MSGGRGNQSSDGLSGRDPDTLRRKAGIGGDPNQDQHFLVDDRVLNRLPTHLPSAFLPDELSDGTSTESGPADHLLEIGAGTGALTDRLLDVAEHVTAVERDRRLVEFLQEEFADAITGGDLTIISGDALETSLPEFDACVSNLPYGISSEILFRLLPESKPLVLTVQREFAQRMVAAPDTDEYGRLSVSTNHYADAEIVETIPPEAFDPQPQVTSAVVRTIPRTPSYEIDDPDFFLRFVKAVFTQRRKTLRNAIRNTAHISGLDDPESVVAAVDDSLLRQRPGKLPPETFAELATIATEHGR